MCFSLCKRPITLDILFPILVKWNLKLRLLSSVRPRKLNSCMYSMGDPFNSKCNRGTLNIIGLHVEYYISFYVTYYC